MSTTNTTQQSATTTTNVFGTSTGLFGTNKPIVFGSNNNSSIVFGQKSITNETSKNVSIFGTGTSLSGTVNSTGTGFFNKTIEEPIVLESQDMDEQNELQLDEQEQEPGQIIEDDEIIEPPVLNPFSTLRPPSPNSAAKTIVLPTFGFGSLPKPALLSTPSSTSTTSNTSIFLRPPSANTLPTIGTPFGSNVFMKSSFTAATTTTVVAPPVIVSEVTEEKDSNESMIIEELPELIDTQSQSTIIGLPKNIKVSYFFE